MFNEDLFVAGLGFLLDAQTTELRLPEERCAVAQEVVDVLGFKAEVLFWPAPNAEDEDLPPAPVLQGPDASRALAWLHELVQDVWEAEDPAQLLYDRIQERVSSK